MAASEKADDQEGNTMVCDNCDEPIEHTSDSDYLSASLGPPEWVHSRTHAPECRRDGRLIGGVAEPGDAE